MTPEQTPPQDRAAAIIAAIDQLREEVVTLRQVIYEAHHRPRVPDWLPGPPQDTPPAPGAPTLGAAAETTPAPPVAPTSTPEKQHTVTVAGQVARVPVLTRTPRGKPLAKFELVVADGEHEEHHSILAFAARAAKARSAVRRGDDVEVIGYPHPRQVRQPDGTMKTVSEVYAVRVIRTSDRKALV